MKILYLTKYTELAASSRMRSYQYFPYLEKEGLTITVKPFFDDAYLQELYNGKKNIGRILGAYIRRFWVLFTVFQYDKIVIEKEIFPYFPAWVEQFLCLLGIKYIVDYDDAIFHNYDQSSQPILKKLLGNKIAVVMRNSERVIAGNSYLAEYAKNAGAKKVEIIPTVIDLNRYSPKKTPNDKFIFGWIGTKSTFEKHLVPQKNWILDFLQENEGSEFHIIGIPENQNWHERVRWIPWTEESEIESIQKLDVGIMPLQDSLWEKGKCAYKLIQYGACSIPGVASDVGMNKEVTIPGKTGMLAYSSQDWKNAILELKNKPELRQILGFNARKRVEENYCIQVTAEKWLNILRES